MDGSAKSSIATQFRAFAACLLVVTLAACNGPGTNTNVGQPDSATTTGAGSGASSLSLSASSDSVNQAAGSVRITVNRSGGSSGAISVKYATTDGTAAAGKDYTAATGALQWADADATAKTFTVAISNATPFSGNKTFTVTLSNPSAGTTLASPGTATVTIAGDAGAAVGSLALSAASYTVAQTANSLAVSVTRTGGSTGAVGISYATADATAVAGTDYTNTSGTLSWASGDTTSKSFSIPISNSAPFSGTRSLTVTLSAPGGGALLSAPSSAAVSITGSGASGSGPSAVTNFQMTNQGGPNNTSTSYQAFTWTAAAPGRYPIDHYQIYRNGAPYATTTGTSFVDSNATASNDPTWATPATVYAYQVAAVDSQGNIGPQASQVSTWLYHSGVRYNSYDLSYGGVQTNYQSTGGNPQGGTHDISVYFNNGGFQPVSGPPQAPIDDLELGAFRYMVLDINPGSVVAFNGAPRIGFLSRLPPGDTGPWKGANLFDYGPTPQANTWATYKIPLADLGIGSCNFTGSISGTTLTVTAVQPGCVGVDAGGYVTGPGVPAGTYVNGWSQAGSIGKFVVAGPGINSSTAVTSRSLLYQRTALYKFNITIPNEAPTMYFNNIGWTLN